MAVAFANFLFPAVLGIVSVFGGGKPELETSAIEGKYAETSEAHVQQINPKEDYGVFVGLNPEKLGILAGYDTVVIDASEFSEEALKKIHKSSRNIYAYLNIGSIETFRDYYGKFQDITLGDYENWPDEKWVDVSKKEWQDYVAEVIAADFVNKGVDGFFIDNTDVYYVYNREEIYEGVLKILKALGQYELDIIINGGDTFVFEAMEKKDLDSHMITGVNQESVFTSIDFDTGTFGQQEKETADYYKEYLELCKQNGLDCYLTEYDKSYDSKLLKEIEKYCKQNGFYYYISDSLNLDGNFEAFIYMETK